MEREKLKKMWLAEELRAQVHGWDFSPIAGRYSEEGDLPWNYRAIVASHLRDSHSLLDMDTGGGEFLLSLGHDPSKTSATEGYTPNVALCNDVLLPLGIDFREVTDMAALPFAHQSFDVIINRHGAYNVKELYRVLKPGGMFITQQVGEDNDRELVELLLPGTPKAFPGHNLAEQRAAFVSQGFQILQAQETFRPIRFFDVGALIWFARVIEWEFVGFSVESCFENLLKAEHIIDEKGFVEGSIHRYLLVAQKRRGPAF